MEINIEVIKKCKDYVSQQTKEKTLEDFFKSTIEIVFSNENVDFKNTFNEKFKKLCNSTKGLSENENDSCSKDLMIYLRNLMIKNNLAPNLSLKKTLADYIQERQKLLSQISKSEKLNHATLEKICWERVRQKYYSKGLVNKQWEEKFPHTLEFEIGRAEGHLKNMEQYKCSYDNDGWKYIIIPDNNDWVIGNHYYYNELDHLLTYMVEQIRLGKKSICSMKEYGLYLLLSEIHGFFCVK